MGQFEPLPLRFARRIASYAPTDRLFRWLWHINRRDLDGVAFQFAGEHHRMTRVRPQFFVMTGQHEYLSVSLKFRTDELRIS